MLCKGNPYHYMKFTDLVKLHKKDNYQVAECARERALNTRVSLFIGSQGYTYQPIKTRSVYHMTGS